MMIILFSPRVYDSIPPHTGTPSFTVRGARASTTTAMAPPHEYGSGAPSTPPYSPGGSPGAACPTNSRCALPATMRPMAASAMNQAQKGAPLAAHRAAVRRGLRTRPLPPCRPQRVPRVRGALHGVLRPATRDDRAVAPQARVDRRGGAALLQVAPDLA